MSSEEPSAPSAGAGIPVAEILERLFDVPGAIRLTCVTRRGGKVEKTSFHPVTLRGESVWQCERFAGPRATARNLDAAGARRAVSAILEAGGPREAHLVTASGDLHLRVTRKGHVLVSRSARKNGGQPAASGASGGVPACSSASPAPHDRAKSQPLDAFDASAYLRVLGFADGSGQVRATMRDKLRQVNEFLRAIDATLGEERPPRDLDIADCGCGRAYLTFAAQLYLSRVRGDRVRIRGIDRNAALVAECDRMARDLGLSPDEARFAAGDIADTPLDLRPHMLLSLHACDTATDEAIARGVEWGCETILSAPCCQHEFQEKLAGGKGPLRAALRHGILRERLADILTDAFRAQILRILGYRVRVVEFVEPSATARNILLRAEAGARPGLAAAVAEYRDLAEFCHATPYLATRLAARLGGYLDGSK